MSEKNPVSLHRKILLADVFTIGYHHMSSEESRPNSKQPAKKIRGRGRDFVQPQGEPWYWGYEILKIEPDAGANIGVVGEPCKIPQVSPFDRSALL